MEVQDGFIVGIFNYCDSWCERCRFTSRCRLFADRAEMEAELDPHLRPVADAPPRPAEAEPPSPLWMKELIEDLNEAARQPVSEEDWEQIRPRVPAEHKSLNARAKEYARRTYEWLTATGPPAFVQVITDATLIRGIYDQCDQWCMYCPATQWCLAYRCGTDLRKPDVYRNPPLEVCTWYHQLVPGKIYRALISARCAARGDAARHDDAPICANVALIGMDRSLEALAAMAVEDDDARLESLQAQLRRLRREVEARFPSARAFVRPGLDAAT